MKKVLEINEPLTTGEFLDNIIEVFKKCDGLDNRDEALFASESSVCMNSSPQGVIALIGSVVHKATLEMSNNPVDMLSFADTLIDVVKIATGRTVMQCAGIKEPSDSDELFGRAYGAYNSLYEAVEKMAESERSEFLN